MPWYVSRVVCGFGVTMAILVPTSAFSSVDLPTLVRPTSTASPDLKFGSVGCSTAHILPRMRTKSAKSSRRIMGNAPTIRRGKPCLSCCVPANLLQIIATMTWKEKLADKLPRALGDEIDVYETQLELRKLGKIDEKLFAET